MLSLVVVGLTTILADDFTESSVREMFTFDFSGLFILLLGVTGMAGEWRHRTITSSVLASPDRIRLLAAKMIAYAVAGTVLSLIVTVSFMAGGHADPLAARRDDARRVRPHRRAVAQPRDRRAARRLRRLRRRHRAQPDRRHRRAARLRFALEPALLAVVPEVGKFGPTTGAPSGIIGISPVSDGGDPREGILDAWPALAVMIAWVGLGFAATAALLQKRDLV